MESVRNWREIKGNFKVTVSENTKETLNSGGLSNKRTISPLLKTTHFRHQKKSFI